MSGDATIESTSRPIQVSTMTAAVRASPSVEPGCSSTRRYARKVAIAASVPAGIANRATRRRKPGRARSVLGASARKNDGMPIVSAPTSVRWRGRNGKTRPNTPTASEISIA